MSHERRHLRFLITSALLVGPALGCGGAEPETETVNTVAPVESQPTGNPVEPEPEPAIEDPTGNPGGPEPEPIAMEPTEATEPAPGVNTNSRRQRHEQRLLEQRERELSEGPIPYGPSVDDRPEAAPNRED